MGLELSLDLKRRRSDFLKVKVKEHKNLAFQDWEMSNLRGACLNQANLCSANLQFCNLSRASFKDANLQHANLNYADVTGADLRGADLRGAFLHGCWLRAAQLESAIIDSTTVLPADFPVEEALKRGVKFEEAELLTRKVG